MTFVQLPLPLVRTVTAWTGDEAALRRAVRLARVAGAVVLSINRPDAHGDERVRLTHWLMALVMRGLTGSSDAAAGVLL